MVLVAVLVGLSAVAALAPAGARRWGRDTGYWVAAAFALCAVALAASARGVLTGQPVEASLPWLPSAGIVFSLRLDALSLLFALLVLGVGTLVMAYCARYLAPGTPCGRLYALLTLFGVAMLGLVVAGDVLLLFVFWELTSLLSFLLVAGTGRGARQATRALVVTAAGGLALLAGLVLLVDVAGTSDLGLLLAEPDRVTSSSAAPLIAGLIVLGAVTKSAQLPLHFWLPGAMVAVTPVSAYLHAATMVKAGVYLLARFSPLFAGTAAWDLLVPLGLVTAVYGAAVALAQHDLKALLAYSTVSQLGLLVALVGVGTPKALGAALLHTLAHALFKAALFMLVGILDREAGSRDIRDLAGLRVVMPLTATAVALAGLSMAGVPPLAGFVSKEEAFAAFLAAPGGTAGAWAAAGAATVAAALTAAYGLRIFFGAFGGSLRQPDLYEPSRAFRLPAEVAALAGLALGLGVAALNPLMDQAVREVSGAPRPVDLALWHGVNPALGLSVLALTGGAGIYLARGRVDRSLPALLPRRGEDVFDSSLVVLQATGRQLSTPWVAAAPTPHLAAVLGSVATFGLVAALVARPQPQSLPGASRLGDWVVVALVVAAVVALVRTTSRTAAVCLAGLVGLAVAVWFLLLGAPDLTLTQLLVETLTVVLAVLVVRRLPRRMLPVPRLRAMGSALLAAGVGAAAGGAALVAAARAEPSPAGGYVLERAEELTGGTNAVNTVLVDFRALDTLSEITVLLSVALALAVLLPGTQTAVRTPSVVLATGRRLLAPVIAAMSLLLLLRGHDEPGGGFIAGLVGASALALGHLAGRDVGRAQRERAWLALGLGGAVATGLAMLLTTGAFLSTRVIDLAGVKVASSLAFDVGVYLLVLGLSATALRIFAGAPSTGAATGPVEQRPGDERPAMATAGRGAT